MVVILLLAEKTPASLSHDRRDSPGRSLSSECNEMELCNDIFLKQIRIVIDLVTNKWFIKYALVCFFSPAVI